MTISRVDTRVTLQKLEIFCLAVELGGVTRTAEHLRVAQPVVTAHVRSLEERLHTRLFYRDGQRARLTPGGQRVYTWARGTLARTREVAREIDGLSDPDHGTVTVAAEMSLASYMLPGILARFQAARPAADLTLHACEPEEVIVRAEMGECDIALVGGVELPSRRLLGWELLGAAPVSLISAVSGPPSASSVLARELETLPFVAFPSKGGQRPPLDSDLDQLNVVPGRIVLRLGHAEAIKQAVQAGCGVALLPRSAVVQELRAQTLREIRVRDATFSVPVYLGSRKGKQLTFIQAEAANTIRDELARELLPCTTASDPWGQG